MGCEFQCLLVCLSVPIHILFFNSKAELGKINRNLFQISVIALFVSFLVNLLIVAVFAAAFFDENYATLRQAVSDFILFFDLLMS